MCKDASLGDVDPDTATGEEGDIQTKCFRGFMSPALVAKKRAWLADRSAPYRTRLDPQLLGRHDLHRAYERVAHWGCAQGAHGRPPRAGRAVHDGRGGLDSGMELSW